MSDMKNKKITILTPVYNDWQSFQILLERLNELASDHQWILCVNAINDGSIQEIPEKLWQTRELFSYTRFKNY